MQDELELLALARSLDEGALARIHDMYYQPLFRYIAFRVSDQQVAEDLTGEVFLRLLNALRDWTAPHKTLRGWLYGVAGRLVADYYRREKRYQQIELDEGVAGADDLTHVIEMELTHENLRMAMKRLTEEQQNVIALRFGWEMSIQEVAALLGKSEGAVKQLQARAVAALTRAMASEGAS